MQGCAYAAQGGGVCEEGAVAESGVASGLLVALEMTIPVLPACCWRPSAARPCFFLPVSGAWMKTVVLFFPVSLL